MPLVLEEEEDDGLYTQPVASTSILKPPPPLSDGSAIGEGAVVELAGSTSPWSTAVPSPAANSLNNLGTNKPRLVLEEDDDFDDDGDAAMLSAQPDFDDLSRPSISRPEARKALPTSYTSKYADLSSINLAAPAQPASASTSHRTIEAAPARATSFAGKRVQMTRRRKVNGWMPSAADKREDAKALAELSAGMLECPYQDMLNSIQSDESAAKKQALADLDNAGLQDELQDAQDNPENTLWTDRYRPKRFTDLLGDERVHRSALLWLKEWDECVFKGTAKTSAAAELSRERRKKRAREANPALAAFDGPEREPDPLGRPHEKILLLCGPPGLGKTTLAYVLARQAGYQVMEVNASDDRTGRVVDERIRNALESRALTAGGGMTGGKPTCVIIDEVDGAGGAGESSFVRTLVKLVTDGTTIKKYKGKGKRDTPLIRPIICICNDLYAPVLRPLRPLAKIIRFNPPTNAMLVTRLRTICAHEQLTAESKHLTYLAETAEGDLRSCLNTLQFIKRRTKVVDQAAIKSVVGQKDTGTSAQQVLDRLFKKLPRKKGADQNDDKFVTRIVRDVQTSGEYEKISQGCFEAYLGAKQVNEAFPRILDSLDWLFFYDRLDSKLRSERDYELLGYVPYAFVPWHKLFASHTQKQLEFPKTDYEAYQQRVAHQEVVDAFRLGLPWQLKTAFTGTNVVAELLPLLNRILNPEIKPVNSQLVRKEEKEVLTKLVGLMVGMKLGFVQDKNEDGQLTYKLEPPIDVFVHFEGKRASDMAPQRYAARHLIANEIQAELGRRGESGEVLSHTASDIISAYKIKPAQAVAPPTKAATDFFGRVIVTKAVPVAAPGGGGGDENEAGSGLAVPVAKKARRVGHAVYKYHEGFSNAVKVTKRVGDFLGI